MSRDTFAQTCLAAAFLLVAAVPAASAQKDVDEEARRRPPVASGPPVIVLYSDTNLRGTSVELTADQYSIGAVRFNDKARSVEVKGGVWLLCSDAGLRGTCEYVDRTLRNLGEIGLSGKISSVQPTEYDKGPRSYDISFFVDSSYRGAFKGFDTSEASLRQHGFNDKISSVIVNRGDWLVCEHADFRGRCELISESMTELGSIGLNDQISSFRKYDVRREGPWYPPVTTPAYPPSGGQAGGFQGEQTMFFPAPTYRGARISNREGAATRFCQDQGFYEAVYKAPGSVLSDVLCR